MKLLLTLGKFFVVVVLGAAPVAQRPANGGRQGACVPARQRALTGSASGGSSGAHSDVRAWEGEMGCPTVLPR